MMGWGAVTERRAGLTLALAGVLLAVSLVLLLWCDAEARAAEQGNWCERTGRTYNANGDLVATGRWSDDGGETWK